MNVIYLEPFIIEEPEKFSLDDFVRNIMAMDVERVFYFDGKLFAIEYEALNGIADDKFMIVEVVTYSAFTEVGEFRRWILYHSNDDRFEYTNTTSSVRGDTRVIPVVKTNNRFLRKLSKYIEEGKYRSQ